MKTVFITILLFCSCISFAQENNKGVRFETDMKWEDVLAKARKENKFIFVDCYATWCGPCKQMDQKTYTSENVGLFFNDKFISVKYQLDTTENDPDNIKQLYKDASFVKHKYGVNLFPTFLFFSPEGTLVHKDVAFIFPAKFIEVGKSALDPNRQYITRIDLFERGILNADALLVLAKDAFLFKDKELAKKVINAYVTKFPSDYEFSSDLISTVKKYDTELATRLADKYCSKFRIQDLQDEKIRSFVMAYPNANSTKKLADAYLESLPNDSLLTKKNIWFWNCFVSKADDPYFKLLYTNRSVVNDVMGDKNWAYRSLFKTLRRDIAMPVAAPNGKWLSIEPNWSKVYGVLSRNYDKAIADQVVTSLKIEWFEYAKKWDSYVKQLIYEIETYGTVDAIDGINNFAFYVVLPKSNDQKDILKVAGWLETLLLKKGNEKAYDYTDTYANLLYKAGLVDKAIKAQEKALEMLKAQGIYNAEVSANYIKMKKGQPTWPVN